MVEDGTRQNARLRARAVLLGFLLCFPVCYAGPIAPQSSNFSLLIAPVVALLCVLPINAAIARFRPQACLSKADLMVIFGIISVAGAISCEWSWIGHSAIHRYAIEAQWNPTAKDILLPNLPDWLAIKDLKQVNDIGIGGQGFSDVVGKLPMLFPRYVGWGILFIAVITACLCVNSLMRQAWTEREKLAFPIVQLPVAMTEGGKDSMWRSKAMWGALLIMFALDMLNGLNYLFPNVPHIPVKQFTDLEQIFRDQPLHSIGQTPIGIYPFLAAIGLFMPSDLLISLIVFFVLRKLSHIALASFGIAQSTFSGTYLAPGPPYFDEQTWGGILAMFVAAMWVSRGTLREVWQQVRTGAHAGDGGVRHRTAFLILLVCFGVVVGYGMVGELPFYYTVPYFALFLIFSLVVTRIRAQLGPPTNEFAFFGPNSLVHRVVGNKWVNPKQSVFINQVFLIMNRLHRTHPMPFQLEAMKVTGDAGASRRGVFWSLLVAGGLAFFIAYFTLHLKAYRTGDAMGWGDGMNYVNNMTQNPKGPDVVGIGMTVFGFAMVMGLDSLRYRFPGLPLHPAGYVLSMNFGVDYYWFGLLLALLIKSATLRYFGLSGYGKLRHIAFGIILGEYINEAIWMAMAILTHQSTYTIGFNDRSLGVQ